MNKITIDLLRHGEAANGEKLRGHTDDPLSELGWQQMNSVVKAKVTPWQTIISSDLKRCHEFAIQISKQLNLPLTVNPSFKEYNFGEWDGLLFKDLYQSERAEDLQQFKHSPSSITPPQGESYQQFKLRVLDAWNQLLASLQQQKIEHCLLVTHSGVIKVIVSEVLGLPEQNLFRIEVPHACLSRISQYQGSPASLTFHNSQL
jgi:alpha-ribazole phosphatase